MSIVKTSKDLKKKMDIMNAERENSQGKGRNSKMKEAKGILKLKFMICKIKVSQDRSSSRLTTLDKKKTLNLKIQFRVLSIQTIQYEKNKGEFFLNRLSDL